MLGRFSFGRSIDGAEERDGSGCGVIPGEVSIAMAVVKFRGRGVDVLLACGGVWGGLGFIFAPWRPTTFPLLRSGCV